VHGGRLPGWSFLSIHLFSTPQLVDAAVSDAAVGDAVLSGEPYASKTIVP